MSASRWMSRLRALFAPDTSDTPDMNDEPYTSDLVPFDEQFAVSPALFDQLRAARASSDRYADEVEQRLDGFILDPGLGPAVYLAGDGRIGRGPTRPDDGQASRPRRAQGRPASRP